MTLSVVYGLQDVVQRWCPIPPSAKALGHDPSLFGPASSRAPRVHKGQPSDAPPLTPIRGDFQCSRVDADRSQVVLASKWQKLQK